MLTQIKEVYLTTPLGLDPPLEIRVDWHNDRHHTVTVRPPYGRYQVADALARLRTMILNDRKLEDAEEGD